VLERGFRRTLGRELMCPEMRDLTHRAGLSSDPRSECFPAYAAPAGRTFIDQEVHLPTRCTRRPAADDTSIVVLG
jgi:hypothetical protein